jgi:RND family efflux transporter MFP subunit
MNRGQAALGMLPAAFLIFLLALVACEGKPAPEPPPPPKVTVSQPLRRDVLEYLELTGNTQALNTAQLRARVEGTLEKIFFQDGDRVKKDQLLFLIQQNTFIAKLQQAEGNVLAQKALLEHAKIELARNTTLFNQKAASQSDLENWRFQNNSAQAALQTAEAQRDLAKLDLGYTRVTAPFDGRIDRRLVDPGNLVGSGTSTVLAEISQTDPLYVYFTVSETDAAPLMQKLVPHRAGEKPLRHPVFIGLAGDEGYPHEGYLDFTATSISTTTGTLLVRGVLPNADGQLLPGQFARVRVPLREKKSALLVPKVAVGLDQLGSFVFVVDEKNIVERRSVRTGVSEDGMYSIDEGLTGDERVIVNGLVRSAPGRPVTPEPQRPVEQPAEASPAGKNAPKVGQ